MQIKKIVADKYVLTIGEEKIFLTKSEIEELILLLAQEITGENKHNLI